MGIGPVWVLSPPNPNQEPLVATTSGPPPIVLPRMPGDRFLREDAAWDEESGAWVVTQSLNVPARIGLVETFYRKAFTASSIELTGGVVPDESGAVRAILRGRVPRRHVQLSLRQPAGTLTTRVRVIWKLWTAPAEVSG